jgi:hypothetical protein
MTRNTKILAWGIFLMFFIEAGALGLLPRNLIFVYRNMRISDILLYILLIYSVFCLKEYQDLYKSRVFLVVKILMLYMLFQFIISVIAYKVNVVEYFFRLKYLWMSFLVLPYLLLIKRGGVGYLVKLIFPIAVVSNVLYILSALTGVAFLPDIGIVQQDLPGGLKVFRVYGGTFFGEVFMLAIVFYWNEYKFKLMHIPLFILFAFPHVLAFGRSAWVFFTFAIVFIIIWSSLRRHDVKTTIRQIAMIVVTISAFLYFFNQFIPESDELTEAIEARIQQGQTDLKYEEGTYGTRLANIKVLLDLWAANPIFGIGMHPFWVVAPVTNEECVYAWGLSDIRWTGVLAAYGIIGFLIAIIFQVYYLQLSFRLLRKILIININYFFLLIFLITLLRESVLNYSYILTTVNLYGIGSFVSFYIANIIYLYEKHSGTNIKSS